MARVYAVLSKEFLQGFGVKPATESPFNAHALVGVKATKEGDSFHSIFVESVVGWGFKEENLQKNADLLNDTNKEMRLHLDNKNVTQ